MTAPVSGLPAGETFSVQLTVASNDSIQVSDLVTFSTPPLPRIFPVPPASDATSTFGCVAPVLDAYNAKPKPGDRITIAGRDLGVGGSAVLGDQALVPEDWSPSAFKLDVPENATGTLALTVNCGHRSNTIAIALFQKPDSRFSITKRSVTGSTATLSVETAGPGKLETSGSYLRAAKATIKRPGTATIKIKLSDAGTRALRKARTRTLRVAVRVRFTPAGGDAASKTVSVTLKRKAGR